MFQEKAVEKKENVPKAWSTLLRGFSEDFQEKIEKEWNHPFAEVYSFLTSRSRRQLAYIAMAGKATERLCFELSKLAGE